MLFYVLAFAGGACMIAALIAERTWLAIGFFLFAGLGLVLYPRGAAGDPEGDAPAYSWMIPESQPARSIVTFLTGLACIGIAVMLIFR